MSVIKGLSIQSIHLIVEQYGGQERGDIVEQYGGQERRDIVEQYGGQERGDIVEQYGGCLLYTSPSPRD